MFDVKAFKERLRAIREAKGINQEDFAKKIGIARASASYYENTKNTALPNAEVLYRMAEYFDVSVDYLLGRSEAKLPEYSKIVEVTGLREKAIENLQMEVVLIPEQECESLTGEVLKEELHKAFDAFVSNDSFLRCMSNIAAYIYPNGKWNKAYKIELASRHSNLGKFDDNYDFAITSATFSKILLDLREMGAAQNGND